MESNVAVQAVRSEILVRLLVVSCTPVVEVLVKRPDIKYQLGFSVQNGVVSGYPTASCTGVYFFYHAAAQLMCEIVI